MAKNEAAAIERAVKAFRELDGRDQKTVLTRLSTGVPKMGLVGMARVEEIHADISDDGKTYLLSQLQKIAPKAE